MPRVITYLRIGADSLGELDAHASKHGGEIPDYHTGPDGCWRGTVVLSDTERAAIRRWDRELAAVLRGPEEIAMKDQSNNVVRFWESLFSLAERRGVSNISALPGAWIVDDLGDGWTIAVNGTQGPVSYLGSELPPQTTVVHHGGMPIAVVDIASIVYTGDMDPLFALMAASSPPGNAK